MIFLHAQAVAWLATNSDRRVGGFLVICASPTSPLGVQAVDVRTTVCNSRCAATRQPMVMAVDLLVCCCRWEAL
jgi:hypothetical protein